MGNTRVWIPEREEMIPADGEPLRGILKQPKGARAIIAFSGVGPPSARVADVLRESGFGTLVLTSLPEEDGRDIDMPSWRLIEAIRWLGRLPEARNRILGLVGFRRGAGIALRAAADIGERIRAVVGLSAHPWSAADALTRVKAATLLIAGARDVEGIARTESAYDQLNCEKQITVIPEAGEGLDDPGAADLAAQAAAEWFERHLQKRR